MAWALKLQFTDEVIESGLVQDFDASLSGIGQELGAGAYSMSSMSDVLALPIFKQEESNLPPDNENKIIPFQYVLCAATSPAIKLHDETLTYLNQGQSYEIRLLDNRKLSELPEITGKMVKSIIRVVFHDRQLQYKEHQQLKGWSSNRPGDRILDLNIPLSVGMVDPRANPTQLNIVEFLWNPSKRTSVFIQVHCISTEFTIRKHGGEKGVPFRIQIDTFKENDGKEHLHSASCQVKVFKPKGADRKQKTDREKMEKRAPQEREKYQPSYETTILTECSPWPEVTYVNNSPSPGFNSSHNSIPVADGNGSPSHQPEPVVQVADSYEIRLLDNRKLSELPEITGKMVKSIIRVVFHDRQLQYKEHQQLKGWSSNRPGDRILDLNIPLSVGMVDPRANPTQLNIVEFLWNPSKRTSVFIQVHCISTEFTIRKHGGEKGVPFRIQIDTFKENDGKEHLHSASCQVKVFKPKGADRKQKTDREKMEKRAPQEREKYQPSYETTILTECSPWPEVTYVNNSPSPGFNSSHNSIPVADGNGSPSHQPEPVVQVADNMLPAATPQDAQQWLHRNRFSPFCQGFTNFSGADLLSLTREDVIQICGLTDGIRLFNKLKGRVVRPRLTVYVCQKSQQDQEQHQKHENEDTASSTFFLYHAIYLEDLTAVELTEKIAQLFISPIQISQIFKQGPTGIHVLVSDEMIQNFQDEVCFVLNIIEAETNDVYHIILK